MKTKNTINNLLWEIIRLQFVRSHELFEVYGLHPGQPPLLMCLYHENGLSQSVLASRLYVKPSTITVMIKRLENSGMVYKQVDENDKRICRTFLSEKGYTTCKALEKLYEQNELLYNNNLSIEEQVLLKRLLMQVRDNLHQCEGDDKND
ncbi:MAG: MarR family transcriptional regulator [Niameybacter sp.]|uniref:MarR family winged helix-turn-helix transcriptional regulator n=1 Tax=Niameybacter sp. TaxID=2033640 RepID=UPI002FCA327D